MYENWETAAFSLVTCAAIIAIFGVIVAFTACDNGTTPTGNPDQTPTAADFTISGTGTFTYDGSPKTVTVTAKTGKTGGTVTVKYNGSAAAPSAVGTYTVTFDVTAATGWNSASGLSAGTLVIKSNNNEGGEDDTTPTFTSISEFAAYLAGKPANTASASYRVKLNIKDADMADLKTLLLDTNKYVYLDLSGSTITEIPYCAFYYYVEKEYNDDDYEDDEYNDDESEESFTGCAALVGIIIPNSVTKIGDVAFGMCTSLTSVTIPNSVTSIGKYAFYACESLTSVTFERADIYLYENYPFPGDLGDKYLAGGIGTYTTTAPVDFRYSEWTKQ